MTSTVFGIRSPQSTDSLASMFFSIQHEFEKAIDPSNHPPIDFLTILNYTPERLAPWKKTAKNIYSKQGSFYLKLMSACERRIQEDKRNGCFIEDVIVDKRNSGLTKEMVA